MAAGVYFEERRGLLASLHRLLQVRTPLGQMLETIDES
jgi:hypothetical protein